MMSSVAFDSTVVRDDKGMIFTFDATQVVISLGDFSIVMTFDVEVRLI